MKDKLDIINLYNSHTQIKDIADIYKIPVGRLRYWLKNQYEINWRGKNRLSVNATYFDDIDTPNKAYIIGFISADGSVNKNLTDWGIELQFRDKYILERIKNEMKFQGEVKDSFKKTKSGKIKRYSRLRMCNKHLIDKLISHGICPRKTYKFSLPTCINDHNINHFMRGFFDGDGCLCVNDKKPSYAITLVCEKSFSYQLQTLLKKHLNIDVRINDTSNVINHVIIESAVNIEKFLEWIYKDCDMKLERKYQIFLKFKELKESGKILTKRSLIPSEVREVRNLLNLNVSENKISKQFGVNRGVIHRIKLNKTYSDVV